MCIELKKGLYFLPDGKFHQHSLDISESSCEEVRRLNPQILTNIALSQIDNMQYTGMIQT